MCVCLYVCVCVCVCVCVGGEDVFVVHLLFIFIFTMYVNVEYSCHLTPSLTFPFQLELPVVKEDVVRAVREKMFTERTKVPNFAQR